MLKQPEYIEYHGDIDDVPRLTGGRERFNIYVTEISHLPLHYHDYAELSYFIDGDGVETINGVNHHLKEGTVSLVLPNHMHTIQSEGSKHVRKYSCLFDMQLLHGLQDDHEFHRYVYQIGNTIPSFCHLHGSERVNMRNLIETLFDMFQWEDQVGQRQLIRVKLTEAILQYIRYCNNQQVTKEQVQPPTINVDSELLLAVLHYVNTHYMRSITLESIAETFNLSASYITHSFRKYTGQSFIKHLQQLRTKSAVNLLVHTNMSITDIALETGFESYRTFARVFREKKGMSAKEYRQAHKHK